MDLKKVRLAAGYTQQDVEDIFGISRRTVQNWENGTNRVPAWADMLIREYLRTPREELGDYRIIAALKKTLTENLPKDYEVLLKCNTRDDALNCLDAIIKCYEPEKTAGYRFLDIGVWESTSDGRPKKCIKHITKEI